MAYEWYADIFCLTSLLMDFCAVYTAGIILNRAVSWKRCMIACVFGVGASVSLLFMIPRYAIYSLLVHGMVHPLMTFMVFGGRDRAGYLRALLTVYIVLFVMGGVQNWLNVLNGRKTGQIIVYGFVAALLFTGYQVRRRVMKNVCRVEVWLSGKSRILWAYCDSGNLLRDPDSGAPVSVLEQELFEQLPQDPVRKKEISYRTIRQEGSMMVVLLDRMDIWQKGTKKQIFKPEIGLQKGPVMQHPRVQMLLHASYFA